MEMQCGRHLYSKGSNDDREPNYQMSTPDRGHYGDAVWETSNSGNSESGSWYGDYSIFPISSYPFFLRGGYFRGPSNAGVFVFDNYNGYSLGNCSFRVVVPVL